MNIRNIKTSIFSLDYQNKFYLAQLISADYHLINPSAGDYTEALDDLVKKETGVSMREIMASSISVTEMWDKVSLGERGTCILKNRILNLIVKRTRNNTTTKVALINALNDMKLICEGFNISNIAFYKHDPGFNKISNKTFIDMLRDIFEDTNLNIVICDVCTTPEEKNDK